MKYTLSSVAHILSFFPIKKKHRIAIINKKLQGLLEITSQNYKLISEIKANGKISSNYSLYYDYYLKEYPKVKPEIIKECVLEYINSSISPKKAISIDNINDFSADILEAGALQNIDLIIYSFRHHNKRINKNNTTTCKYITINIIDKNEKIRAFDLNYFFDEVVNPNLPYFVLKMYNKDIKLLLYEKLSHLIDLKAMTDYYNQLFWNDMFKNFDISHFKKLEFFYLTYNTALTERFINFLKEQSALKYIEVFNKGGSFREFLELVQYNKQTLKTIRINDFNLEPEISFLDFPKLEELDFDYSALRDPINPKNFILPKLERYYVPRFNFSIDDLKQLIEQNPSLEEVRIKLYHNYDIEEFRAISTLIEPIRKLTKLTEIYIDIPKRITQGSAMIQYLSFIASIKSETATLVSTNEGIIDIDSVLKNFPKITAIEGVPMINRVNKKKLLQLKIVKLFLDESTPEKQLRFIQHCKNLQKIKITGIVTEDMFKRIISEISELTNLRSIKFNDLEIKNTSYINESYFSSFLLGLNKYKQLKRLYLPNVSFDTEFIEDLKLPLLQGIKMKMHSQYTFPVWVHQNFLNISGYEKREQFLYFNHIHIENTNIEDDEDIRDACSYVSSSSRFSI